MISVSRILESLLSKLSNILGVIYKVQKQPFAEVFKNRCFQKSFNIHRKIYVPESLCNKVADLKACNFIKKRLHASVFQRILQYFQEQSFIDPLRWLLLNVNVPVYRNQLNCCTRQLAGFCLT